MMVILCYPISVVIHKRRHRSIYCYTQWVIYGLFCNIINCYQDYYSLYFYQ